MNPEVVKIITLATINEALTEYLFSDVPAFERHIKKLSMVIGIIVAVLFKADLFPLIGIESIYPIASYVLTGILISRGSNLINTLMELVKNFKDRQGGVN